MLASSSLAILLSATAVMATHEGRSMSHSGVFMRRNTSLSAAPRPLEKRDSYNGATMTWYPTNTGPDACTGKNHLDSDWFVAMNVPQYNSGGCCGKQLTINYNGKSALVTCVDECETCPDTGMLDLTMGLFEYFVGDPGIGQFYGDWSYGDTANKPTTTSTTKQKTTTSTTHTTTSTHTTPTTTSTTSTTSTTHSSSASSSSKSASASASASLSPSSTGMVTASGAALGGALPTPGAGTQNNLAQFSEAMVNVLGVVVDAVQAAAA
ncbi:hypothetical protein B0H11DRAFT_1929566 [Mycena galericulata]|nr:hypothetical protein B0H11DRAFT_1929566 [Mycena galericulata]